MSRPVNCHCLPETLGRIPKLTAKAGAKGPPPLWYQRVTFCRSVGSSALPVGLVTRTACRMSAPAAVMSACRTRFFSLFR